MTDSPLIICDQVRRLLHSIRIGNPAPPPAALVDHITMCATCRGALAMLAASIAAPPPAHAFADCTACQADLAAYIEYERTQGTPAAARVYSQVWWHLWICPACAETYRLTTALAEAAHVGTLPPLPFGHVVAAPRRLLRSLRLQRTFLNYALPRHIAAFGTLRSDRSQATVLFADDDDSDPLTLSVQRQPDDNWRVSVRAATPLAAWLVLTLAERSFRAYFNPQGKAIIHDIPDELFGADSGPDLVIGIEFDAHGFSGD